MSTARQTARQGLRFLLAGGVNTLFGWSVYSLCIHVGLPPWSALLLSTVLGVAFNFMTIGGYVFRAAVRAHLPRFVAAYGLVYALNLGALYALRPWVSGDILAQSLLTPPMALLCFVLMKRWVFAAGARA